MRTADKKLKVKIDLIELESVIKNFDSLDFSGFKSLWNKITEDLNWHDNLMTPSIGVFESPFESKVCYGFRFLNFNNLLVKNIFRLVFSIYLKKKKVF